MMKSVTPHDHRVVEISKYVFTAGVLAGTCYGSYKRLKKTDVPAKPAQATGVPAKQHARAAVA